MTDDTPTESPPPANDTVPPDRETLPEMVIPRGRAEEYLSAALDQLVVAYQRVEELTFALARQVDAGGSR